MLIGGVLGGWGAFAAYEPIANLRVVQRAKRISAEAALLNFRIVEVVRHRSRFGYVTDRRLKRDQRLLDPQLGVFSAENKFHPTRLVICTEPKPILPMNQ